MSDIRPVFFYSGECELLDTKPTNVVAVNVNNVEEKNNALNEIGKNLNSVPCIFVRDTITWYDEIYNKTYVLPEQWVCKNLSDVNDWNAVGLVPTEAVVKSVVEVLEEVVEPVVEQVVEAVVEAVVEPVVEEAVVEPVVEPVVEAVVEQVVIE